MKIDIERSTKRVNDEKLEIFNQTNDVYIYTRLIYKCNYNPVISNISRKHIEFLKIEKSNV